MVSNAGNNIASACADAVIADNPLVLSTVAILSVRTSLHSFRIVLKRNPQNYDIVRDALCLQDTTFDNNGAYCPTEVLSHLESSAGKTVSYGTYKNVMADPNAFKDVASKSAICSDCGHGLVTAVQQVLNATKPEWSENVTEYVEEQCGGEHASLYSCQARRLIKSTFYSWICRWQNACEPDRRNFCWRRCCRIW